MSVVGPFRSGMLYRKQLDSPFADLKNVGGSPGGKHYGGSVPPGIRRRFGVGPSGRGRYSVWRIAEAVSAKGWVRRADTPSLRMGSESVRVIQGVPHARTLLALLLLSLAATPLRAQEPPDTVAADSVAQAR